MADTAVLLLTDVVDSTKLVESLGTDGAARVWQAHDRVARDLLRGWGGREIDKTDGFLLLFATVAGAVGYAAAYHRAIAAIDPPLSARAGVHVGPVVLRENTPEDVSRGAKPLEVEGIAKPTAARVMSIAQGGQTLLSREAFDGLGGSVPLLTSDRARGVVAVSHGHWQLKGVSEPVELFEVGEVGAAPLSPPPDAAKAWRVVAKNGIWLPIREIRHGLPAERDAFVGRDVDLASIARRIGDGARLITVLGSGGCGKTRLVTRYAWTWLGQWPGGAWFCDLSEARDATEIANAVARNLEVPLADGDPVAQLGHAIAGRGECLVVLDNFEQVARFADDTLGRWLDRAPEARFVVTTREVLGLPGEHVIALAPLEPDDAVALFAARAEAAKTGFEMRDRASVEALVSLLDRIPLAIELAAARVRVMPPDKILERMSDRFRLLTSAGGRVTRQSTLRATLDWSWELLSPDEQAALAQLSVFEGGFDLEACEAVLALAELWPMDAVQALADKSLVHAVGEARFAMLQSVQAYASERLDASGDRPDAEIRHGAWIAAFGEDEALETLHVHGGVARRKALEREAPNAFVAARRAIARGDGDTAVLASRVAYAGTEHVGAIRPTIGLLTDAVAASGVSRRLRAVGLVQLAIAANAGGEARRWSEFLPEAQAIFTELGDRAGLSEAMRLEATCRDSAGGGREAAELMQRALEHARAAGDRRLIGATLARLATVTRKLGDLDGSVAFSAESSAIHLERGDVREMARDLAERAMAADERGDRQAALDLNRQSLAMHRAAGNRAGEGLVLGNLANQLKAIGDREGACVAYEEALRINQELGRAVSIGVVHGNLGEVLWSLGRVEEGLGHMRSALEIHRRVGFRYGQAFWLMDIARHQQQTGDAGWDATSAEAVAVAADFPAVEGKARSYRAEMLIRAGRIPEARAQVEAARALSVPPVVAVMVATADVSVCVAEGRLDAAREALDAAEAFAARSIPPALESFRALRAKIQG